MQERMYGEEEAPTPQVACVVRSRDGAQQRRREGRLPHAAWFLGVDGGVRKERALQLAAVGWTA
jgi:hypothetical protein